MDKLDLDDPVQRKLFKEVLGEAIDSWLDKQFTTFGKWTFRGLISVAIGGLAYLYFQSKGIKL